MLKTACRHEFRANKSREQLVHRHMQVRILNMGQHNMIMFVDAII